MKKILAFFTFYFFLFNFQFANAQKEVKIGTQVWMSKNLNVEKFRNGDVIPNVKTDEEWEKAGKEGKPAWCYYNNDPKNGKIYGKLYNWYAVNDSRGLAPKGWHVPSDDEWTVLTAYLGGEEKAGIKMKSKTGWIEVANGTNSIGFSGLPGGYRYDYGPFGFIGYFSFWWSSTESDKSLATYRCLNNDLGNVTKTGYNKAIGFSVRCVRD